MKSAVLLFAVVMTGSAHAQGIAECQVRVLRPVIDDMGNHWSAGKLLRATVLRTGSDGLSFCSHGGSCVPRMNGGHQAAVLVDCDPGPILGNPGWGAGFVGRRIDVFRRESYSLRSARIDHLTSWPMCSKPDHPRPAGETHVT